MAITPFLLITHIDNSITIGEMKRKLKASKGAIEASSCLCLKYANVCDLEQGTRVFADVKFQKL